ncbi:hypothetical protein Asp14428_14960 [Actinoplanes sp. NBRC 14428]|nr:hypothetical protein Asp14428_14960 [Actinoplanes sp. NBRC 14428]
MTAADLPDVILTTLAPEDRYAYLVGLVRVETAILIGRTDPGVVLAGTAFADLGLTSVQAAVLPRRLARLTGIPLPAGLVADHPTPAAAAALIHDELFGDPLPDLLATIDALRSTAGRLGAGGRGRLVARLHDLLTDLDDTRHGPREAT